MGFHIKLLDLCKDLGYIEFEGLCFGFSLRWIEACLLGKKQLEIFEKRMQLINSTPTEELINAIRAAQAKQGINISAQEQELLDILPFLESLTVYHLPGEFKELFANKSLLTQKNIEEISKIASSIAIEQLGGLKVVHSTPFAANKKEIQDYLDRLSIIFERSSHDCKKPITLSLRNLEHAISIAYLPGEGWLFRDINLPPGKNPLEPLNSAETAALIVQEKVDTPSGEEQNKSNVVSFNASVITTRKDPRRKKLQHLLPTWRQDMSEQIAKRAQSNNLAHLASIYGHRSVLRGLFARGLNANQKSDAHVTPIFLAAQEGDLKTFKLLQKNKANIHICKSDGSTPLTVAAALGHEHIVEKLLKSNAQINQGNWRDETPAFWATKKNHEKVIKLLAKHHANFNYANVENHTPAHLLCENGNIKSLKLLLKTGIDLNKKNNEGYFPLSIAVNANNIPLIEFLLQQKVAVNQVNNSGETALFTAVKNNNSEAIALLLRHGADIDHHDKQGATAVFYAANFGCLHSLQALSTHQADLNKACTNGRTPLMGAAIMGQLETVRYLLKNQVQINCVDEEGYSAAFLAASKGHLAILDLLIQNNADLSKTDEEGNSFAIIAAHNGHHCLFNSLAPYVGAEGFDVPNNNGYTPALVAAANGHVDTLKALAQYKVNFSKRNNNDVSPLLAATEEGHLAVIELLVQYGVDLNEQMKNGGSVAFIAAQHGHIHIIDYLIKNNVELENRYFSNAKQLERFAKNTNDSGVIHRMGEFLQQQEDSSSVSMSAFDIAAIMGHEEIVLLLAEEAIQKHTHCSSN